MSFIKQLQVVHFVNLSVAILMSFILYYAIGEDDGLEDNSRLNTAGLIIAFGGVLFSSYYYRSGVMSLKKRVDLKGKLSKFRTISFISWALIDITIAINLVLYAIGAGELMVFLALLLTVYLFLKRPTAKRTIADLELDNEQRRIIQNPDSRF